MRFWSLLLILFIASLGACKNSTGSSTGENRASQTANPGAAIGPTPTASAPLANASHPKIDACTLLTSQEIQAVQGEAIKETKLSGQAGGGMQISQCFFTLPTFSNSISLLVAQRGDGAGAKDPKDFWHETFDKNSAGEKDREREKKEADKNKKDVKRGEEEEEESAAPPQKVAGVGDDAFWIGSRVGGALYVLKGNAYLRVSIGGSGDQNSKISKSKTLAQKALVRL